MFSLQSADWWPLWMFKGRSRSHVSTGTGCGFYTSCNVPHKLKPNLWLMCGLTRGTWRAGEDTAGGRCQRGALLSPQLRFEPFMSVFFFNFSPLREWLKKSQSFEPNRVHAVPSFLKLLLQGCQTEIHCGPKCKIWTKSQDDIDIYTVYIEKNLSSYR